MDDYIEYLIISGEFDSEDDSGNNKNKNNNDNNPGGCLTLVIVVVMHSFVQQILIFNYVPGTL